MNQPIILLFDNWFDTATVTGGSWAAPLTEAQDPRPFRKARSSNLSASSTKLQIDFGQTRSFKAWAVTHTNLTAAAEYRLTWYSDAFSTAVGNTGWLSISGYPLVDPDNIGAAIVHIFEDDLATRYGQIEFNDPDNPDGYVEFGRGITSDYWQPPYNFSETNNEDLITNTPMQKSLGGTSYFNRRRAARQFSFGFPYLDDAIKSDVRLLRRICNLDKQVFVIPEPDAPDDFNEGAFLATMAEMPKIQRLAAGYMSTGFNLVEAI